MTPRGVELDGDMYRAYYYLPSGVLVQHWFHTRQAAEHWLAQRTK